MRNKCRAQHCKYHAGNQSDRAAVHTVGKPGGNQGSRYCHSDTQKQYRPAFQQNGRVDEDMLLSAECPNTP